MVRQKRGREKIRETKSSLCIIIIIFFFLKDPLSRVSVFIIYKIFRTVVVHVYTLHCEWLNFKIVAHLKIMMPLRVTYLWILFQVLSYNWFIKLLCWWCIYGYRTS